jgi:hypothetical protein
MLGDLRPCAGELLHHNGFPVGSERPGRLTRDPASARATYPAFPKPGSLIFVSDLSCPSPPVCAPPALRFCLRSFAFASAFICSSRSGTTRYRVYSPMATVSG